MEEAAEKQQVKEYEFVGLTQILSEVAMERYMEIPALYARFRKMAEILHMDIEDHKNESGEIVFVEDEKEFIKELIWQVGENFLKTINSKKATFKNAQEQLKASHKMQRELEKSIENMKDQELKMNAQGIIEVLSKRSLIEVEINVMNRIKIIGEDIINLNLNSEELTEVFREIDGALDIFQNKLTEKYKK